LSSSDLMFRSAGELAAMVRSGEVSARELVEASLERIDAVNPSLNAFVDVDAEGALAVAEEIMAGDQRPFAGVPVAIKNNRAVAGMRLTYGTRLLADHVAERDDNVVARLRAAGFVIVGTTTVPEFAILPTTEARLFGPTRNPWDLERTPGGSSGGAAAAVASGMVPVAQGSDGGGSIRIPAACCGLFGLKPSRGRISPAPELGDSDLSTDGMLTRTVADTAALLDVLAGYELGDATWAPPPPEPFELAAAREPGPLRIAVTTTPPNPEASVDPLAAAAVEWAADSLAALGHELEEVDLGWQDPALGRLFGSVFSTDLCLSMAKAARIAGRDLEPADVEPMSWAIYSMVTTKISALDGLRNVVALQAFTRRLVRTLDPYDALLTPTLGERPLPLGTLDTFAERPMATFTRSGLFAPFTAVFNASGQPAISVPMFEGEDGLPLAVQLVGRPAGEGRLLALAAQLEAAHPWAERRPPLAQPVVE
jgi:amidase